MRRITPFLLSTLLSSLLLYCGEGEKKGTEERFPMAAEAPDTFGVEGHRIPPFALRTQDGDTLTREELEGKPHVADFFFTTCPTICPHMTRNLKRLQERLKKEDYDEKLRILSFSVDPTHDSAEVLKEYAEKHGADTELWSFLTGEMERIHELGQEGYNVTAQEAEGEPGGYLHSGYFILVDGEMRVRGTYEGTDSSSLDELIGDIRWLVERE